MTERIRRDNALRAAEQYAPSPKSSILTYGIVAMVLAGILLYVVSSFYDIDLSGRPQIVAGIIALAVVGGIGLRWWRRRKSNIAFQTEYQRRSQP
ncbi:hypothetical protein VE25_18015 [Devosia geojensis]|uniref:Uncharacterized protein n=1 Tax=Devosia geojensis TaxID=443610 RepID=A0A0F5FNH2_9HYPH|nr:hypothetical protein [Devosia geojensis]KKB10444.1 hypothetical protein VE25_18015 [Devosia geojensis]